MKKSLFLIFTLCLITFLLCNAKSNKVITTSSQTQKLLPNDIIHITITMNTYKSDTEVLHAYYTYPQFLDSFKQASALNQFYIRQLDKDYKDIRELRSAALENEIPPNLSYAYDHTFEVTFLTNHFLSILENTYQYAGGVQPDTFYQAHTFSLQTGKEVTLENLFLKPKADTEKRIRVFLIQKINKNLDDFYPDAADTISNMPLESFHFYLDKNGITIFFNPFEISPYAGGIVKFPLTP